ncbi:hypothetical protein VKT23_004662 [Stygiomarasmius scandens]|uniref:Uncharacterized protein n=1 Tax=Marasmiellus scandens TaxID=2682957 RepID=A0ABR1JUP8_9AGAR
MAAATTSAAAASVKSAVTVHPPSSPFAELLRRSRFASFDPQIRQTYYSPPSYAHRGNWGLKRPLALRRRNAFITLTKPFDDPAQFTEWDNAENEVRFIRRFEELQVRPQTRKGTPWHRYLGNKNETQWLIDSEFCERYEGPEAEEEMNVEMKNASEAEQKMKSDYTKNHVPRNLAGLGNAGEGAYGHRGPALREGSKVALLPNVNAMSPKQFERYVEKLRELRPKFKEYLQNKGEFKGKSTFQLSQDLNKLHFRFFLEQHTAESFADVNSGVIEQRPHAVGGLLYSHPSKLHSQLFSKPQPGIVLGGGYEDIDKGREQVLVASFAGMTSVIRKEHWQGKRALLDHTSEAGIKRENLANSVATMRLKPENVLLEEPPRSVGTFHRGLMGTKIKSIAMVDNGRSGFSQSNPYRPGTMEYSGMKPAAVKGSVEVVVDAPKFQPKFTTFTPKTTNKNKTQVLNTLMDIFEK